MWWVYQVDPPHRSPAYFFSFFLISDTASLAAFATFSLSSFVAASRRRERLLRVGTELRQHICECMRTSELLSADSASVSGLIAALASGPICRATRLRSDAHRVPCPSPP